MSQIKICPDCQAEYFSHIERCADCGTVLVLPEEIKTVPVEKKLPVDNELLNPVVVREGSSDWINEQ